VKQRKHNFLDWIDYRSNELMGLAFGLFWVTMLVGVWILMIKAVTA
jgi:hypothetical protein